jgi:hypothetical protein
MAQAGGCHPAHRTYRTHGGGRGDGRERIAAGLTNGRIASELFITEATVKTHVNHIFAKVGARDRAQAVHYAYQHGLVARRPD